MKKALLICLFVLLILSLASPAYCGPVRKLARGVCNLLTFPCEFYYQIKETSEVEGVSQIIPYGMFKGVVMMIARAGAGFYEVISFPFPIPPNYEPLIKDPEFFFSK